MTAGGTPGMAIARPSSRPTIGAKVNNRLVPLDYRLKNGDIVEIVRNASHKPSRDWLNFAVTSRARNKIKHFIHTQEKVRSIELGKRLFDKDVRRFGIDKAKVTPEELARIGMEYGTPRAEDLYAAIDQLVDKLDRQVCRHKDRIRDYQHEPARRQAANLM